MFISAERAASADTHIIPHGILESAIKIINEPPSGMQANLHKALNNFTQVSLRILLFCFIIFFFVFFLSMHARAKVKRQKIKPQYCFFDCCLACVVGQEEVSFQYVGTN